MLLTLVSRPGLWRNSPLTCSKKCLPLYIRLCRPQTTSPAVSNLPPVTAGPPPALQSLNESFKPATPGSRNNNAELIATWDRANEKFFGPERDYDRFPHPVALDTPPKTRLKFIPESWFEFMYPKTGVLGPYLFGYGFIAYLLSKEIWVVDEGFVLIPPFIGALYLYNRWVGPYWQEMYAAKLKDGNDYMYANPMMKARDLYNRQIEHCDTEISKVGLQKHIDEVKRENVHLQLEAVYRSRLATIHKEVKNRLDYMLDKETSERKINQEHMVNWIVKNVRSSITPEQEKNSISKCIQDLQLLAKSQGTMATI